MKPYETINNYLEYLEGVRHLSGNTITAYREDLDIFTLFLKEREVAIDQVTYLDARRFAAYLLRERGFKPNTVNRKLSTLRGFYRYAVQQSVVEFNPFSRISGTPRYRRLPEVLSRQEVKQVLAHPYNDFLGLRDSLIMNLFYSTGCRRSELLNANLEDLELADERLKVVGKGDKERYVFINPATKALLSDYLPQREGWITNKGEKTRAILVGSRGKRLSPASLQCIFDRYRQELGLLKNFTPHTLRHSFATHMLDRDSGIRVVQELLGHASISTTQIYTHVSSARLKAVYEKTHPHGRKEDE